VTNSDDVLVALDGIKGALNADGYDLAVEPAAAEDFTIRITAGPDACAECLIPKRIMSDMIGAVAPAGITWSLEYPPEHADVS
jgi:hypothetical protein